MKLTQQEKRRRWLAKDPTRDQAQYLRLQFGLTFNDLAVLIVEQNGRCALCSAEPPLVIDHEHTTNAVRGLLCPICNKGLGFLGDTPRTIRRAADYVERKRPVDLRRMTKAIYREAFKRSA